MAAHDAPGYRTSRSAQRQSFCWCWRNLRDQLIATGTNFWIRTTHQHLNHISIDEVSQIGGFLASKTLKEREISYRIVAKRAPVMPRGHHCLQTDEEFRFLKFVSAYSDPFLGPVMYTAAASFTEQSPVICGIISQTYPGRGGIGRRRGLKIPSISVLRVRVPGRPYHFYCINSSNVYLKIFKY